MKDRSVFLQTQIYNELTYGVCNYNLFCQNIFYNVIEAEICELGEFEEYLEKPEAELLKRTQFCVLKVTKYNTIVCF